MEVYQLRFKFSLLGPRHFCYTSARSGSTREVGMNLSFLPGDLHLTKDAEGIFTVTMAGENILSTKSEPFALAKFHTLRTELENQFPARQPTEQEKAALLRDEVADSIVRVGEQKKPAASARISTATLFEVQAALRSYCPAVETSDLSEHSQATYINMADNFVRWLKGDFDPGSRLAPYKVPKKK
jgi:hypothetical protein